MKEWVVKYPTAQLRQSLPPFFAITADKQKSGRGRQNKKWESEAGKNLLLSFLLYPSTPPSLQFDICCYVSVALAEQIAELCPASEVYIKWPNDIYIGNKKVAGILIENFIYRERIKYSIVGIGLNLNQTVFPPSLPNPTSVFLETATKVHPIRCMEAIIEKTKQLETCPSTVWKNRYDDYLYKKEVFSTFILPAVSDTPLTLKITGVSETGLLQLVDENNKSFSCAFDEISYCISE
jgi:BirA family biotin operon repressor/biotin-[acetyl-CoA-carboxylase] ligase